MKILHITDSHATMKTPENRADQYSSAFLRKLVELYYVVRKENIDIIIHTGDLFHASRVSNKFMGQVAEIIKKIGVPFYVVPGNHDIDGYNMSTINHTSLGLFYKAGVVIPLDRIHPIVLNPADNSFSVAISGQEYYAGIDSGNASDFEMQQVLCDANILCYHGYIADTPQHPNIRCTYPDDIVTDADIILSGHYHRAFEIEGKDFDVYNPGSMMRVEMTDYNKKHIPTYGILEIERDEDGVYFDYSFHNFISAAPADKVFDLQNKAVVKKHGITLENFKNSISATMNAVKPSSATGAGSRHILEDVMTKYMTQEIMNQGSPVEPDFVADVQGRILGLYDECLQESLDGDTSVVKGFISAKNPIKISRVEIHGFQSHDNTVIDFHDGLNIITGESSNGKTAIFRAILWVIDNSPSGNAFITNNRKKCSVRITFSDGTYIERGRTKSSTGYYDVFDGTQVQHFEGFSNNIPIEVLNAHQMPKIPVTRNTDTHLNVITQLEKPFLLTDSVNEKAAAIGRITGTDIFDNAIKRLTNKSMEQSRIVTTMLTMQESLEQQLNAFDEAAINAEITAITELSEKADNLIKEITAMNDIINTSHKLNNESKHIAGLLIHLDNFKNKGALITKNALQELNNFTAMEQLVSGHEQYVKEKSSLEERINILSDYTDTWFNVDECMENISCLERMNAITAQYADANKNAAAFRKTISECEEKFFHEDIDNMVHTNKSMCQDVLNIISMIKLYQQASFFKKEYETSISAAEENAKTLNAQIEGIIKERKDFILSCKICPCCGQEITEDHIKSVLNNMEA